MDPKLWEELKRNTERATLDSGRAGVRLVGGIMDGWLLPTDVDALDPDWYKTNPPNMTAGRGYVLSATGTHAEWIPEIAPSQ